MIKDIFTTSWIGHRQGRNWTLNIVDANYTGDPNAAVQDLGRTDVQGAVIKWGNDRDLYQPIVASSMEVLLYVTGAAKNFLTVTLPLTQEFRYFVDLYQDGKLFWRGVILTDAIQFFETPDPLQFRLSAICGLGRLQQFDYSEIEDVAQVSGSQGQLFTEVLKCLKFASVNVDLYSNAEAFIRTNFQWYESNMESTVAGIDPMQLISFITDNTAFITDPDTGEKTYSNIFDYLGQILTNFGLSVTFANGAWQLYQVNQLIGTATTVRYYEYAKNYRALINPANNTGNLIASNVITTIEKEVTQTNPKDKNKLYPLRGVLNSYKAPFSEISTEPLFSFSLLVFRNPAIDLTPNVISENYNLSGSFGFSLNVVTSVQLDGTGLSAPIIVRVEAQMRLSITDGTQTQYLTSTGAWSATNQTFSLGFDTDQLLDGQQRIFTLGTSINSAALPFAGVVSFQIVNLNATQLPNNVNQNSLIKTRLSDITLEHYDTTGNGSIKREFYTVKNQTAGVQSSIKAVLRLPLFDRATRYNRNAVFVWKPSLLNRVHSSLWRKNDAGSYFTIHILVLRESLLRRHLPAKIKEGTYIGFIAPNEKAKDEGAYWAVVSSEFSTGYDQMNRVQIQRLPTDVFTVEPLPSDREEFNEVGANALGGGRVQLEPNTLTALGMPLAPIVEGSLTEITLTQQTSFSLKQGTPLIILDLTTGLPVTATVKNTNEAGVDTIEINSISILQPILAPYLFFPQMTLIG